MRSRCFVGSCEQFGGGRKWHDDGGHDEKEVRHIGMLMACDLVDDYPLIDELWYKLLNNGIYVNITRRSIIICPYLNFPSKELSRNLKKLIDIIEVNYVQ